MHLKHHNNIRITAGFKPLAERDEVTKMSYSMLQIAHFTIRTSKQPLKPGAQTHDNLHLPL